MPKKALKKKNKRMYFDQEVEDAIILYNGLEDAAERSKLYDDKIRYAFEKLSESIINTFKFSYFDVPFEDVKSEVVTFLVMNMHKYDHTKGSKAFSYFSVVAKNYLILNNNSNYKKFKSHDDLSSLNKHTTDPSNDEYVTDLLEEIILYFEQNIDTIFKRKRDINIAYAILELLKKRREIENFNKKALYILIREMTDVDTSKITSVTNVMKRHYKNILNDFYNKGTAVNNKHTIPPLFF
tara:strand:+ start:4187 stop:4903 length:717 start_codon:yes stop_codon:yes gene_type:complete